MARMKRVRKMSTSTTRKEVKEYMDRRGKKRSDSEKETSRTKEGEEAIHERISY